MGLLSALAPECCAATSLAAEAGLAGADVVCICRCFIILLRLIVNRNGSGRLFFDRA